MSKVFEKLKTTCPKDFAIWSGAGLSLASGLPSGEKLTKAVIDYCCMPRTWNDVVDHYFANAKLIDSAGRIKEFPRLEAVIESMISAIGNKALAPLSIFENVLPNERHMIIAEHVLAGGWHVTTNFDSCIELCCPEHVHARIIHLHGCYNASCPEDLGARIKNISAGLPSAISLRLLQVIQNIKYLVFMGYSGSDYFDIDPFFERRWKQGEDLSHLNVIWIKHSSLNCRKLEWQEQPHIPSILVNLHKCGAHVEEVECDALNLLRYLKEQWMLPASQPQALEYSSRTSAPNGVEEIEKLISTVQLYTSMGIGNAAYMMERLLLQALRKRKDEKEVCSKIYYYLNDASRNVGKYNSSIHYARRISQGSAYSIVFSRHRLAGDSWLRGDGLQAIWYFLTAAVVSKLVLALPHHSQAQRSQLNREYAELKITYLHFLKSLPTRFLRSSYVLKWLASRVVRDLENKWSVIESDPHATAKVVRFREELSKGIKSESQKPAQIISFENAFNETDSLLGTANMMRNALQAKFEKGMIIHPEEVDRVYELSSLIGDRPGMLKAALMRKAAHGANTPGIDLLLNEIEWSSSYRARWNRLNYECKPWS